MTHIEYFNTYEELLDFLSRETRFNPPRLVEGSSKFLGKFTHWLFSFEDTLSEDISWKCIYPDPNFNLSYPYPVDEVGVAVLLAEFTAGMESLDLLKQFEIADSTARREIATLSGGELLLVSFAKAAAYTGITSKIFICSPTQWLHPSKYYLLQKLIDIYEENQKDVTLLFLEGEEYKGYSSHLIPAASAQYDPKIPLDAIPWNISFNDLKIVFEEQLFPKKTPFHEINYQPQNLNAEIFSPTLLTGDNGIGKSIFVKMMNGMVKPSQGSLSIRCLGNEGAARLLMQDSLDQLFGETIDDHFSRVFKYDKERGKNAKELFQAMLDRIKEMVSEDALLRNLKLIAATDDTLVTILQIKLALVAERLESRPPLLILDEPDWCLSRMVNRLFVSVVIEHAHRLKVPVLIISHLEDWYAEIFNSKLEFTRGTDFSVNISYDNNGKLSA